MNVLTEIVQSRELLTNLTLRELRGKYKRSLLGWTWSLLNPISMMIIYTIVFGVLFGAEPGVGLNSGIDSFPVWLMCGLLPWNFLSQSLSGSMATLIGNAGLIRKVYFPRELLPFSTVLSLDVSLLIEMGVLVLFIMVLGSPFYGLLPWLLPALLLIVALTAFAAGMGLILSVANVYFRDVQYLFTILLNIWFYATPIVYEMELVENYANSSGRTWLIPLYKANPMVEYVGVFRSLLYDWTMPGMSSVAYVLVWSIAMLVGGLWLFRRFEGRLAEEL
jgi:lipopolysaccharide transport system permease protein